MLMLKIFAFLGFLALAAYGAVVGKNPVFLCSLGAALWVYFSATESDSFED